MAATSRVIQWKQREAQIREIPREGFVEGQLSNECEGRHALVFAGHGRTNLGGSWSVDLAAIGCIAPGPDPHRQPSVVATPTTDAFVDAVPTPYTLVARTTGTVITVWSFDVAGQRASNVEFSWHCMVEGVLVL